MTAAFISDFYEASVEELLCPESMCINVTPPTWTRVRHWSAPERIKPRMDLGEASLKESNAPGLPWEVPLSLEEEFEALGSFSSSPNDATLTLHKRLEEKVESRTTLCRLPITRQYHSLAQQQHLYRQKLNYMLQQRERRYRRLQDYVHIEKAAFVANTKTSTFSSSVPDLIVTSVNSPSPDDHSSSGSSSVHVPEDIISGPIGPTATSAAPATTLKSSLSRQRSLHSPKQAKSMKAVTSHVEDDQLLPPADPSDIQTLKSTPQRDVEDENQEGEGKNEELSRIPPSVSSGSSLSVKSKKRETNSSYQSDNEDSSFSGHVTLLPRSRMEEHSARWTRRPRRRRPPPWCWPSHGLICAIMCVLGVLTGSAQARICGDITIKSREMMSKLDGCSVIEGNLVIALGILDLPDPPSSEIVPDLNATFPELREITDYMMIYGCKKVPRLTNIFPNLAVIRGNKLLENWALIVFENPDMVELGLTGLTKILRGAVRITKNSKLCYVKTIDWDLMTHEDYHEFNMIEENQNQNACPELCPSHCHKLNNFERRFSCWNQDTCQRVEVICPSPYQHDHICYMYDGSAAQVTVCDKECVGGCSGESPQDCYACKNVMFEGGSVTSESGKRNCQSICPAPFLLFMDWRCITGSECKNKRSSFSGESIQDIALFKRYKNTCVASCPPDTKESMTADRTPICEECKDCPKKCNGGLVSSLEVLMKFDGCTDVMGDLIIQLSGSNVVRHLERHLSRVRTISGYLKISRTYPIVSLDFFKSLRYIFGKNLPEQSMYSLHILENENLQKLFPPVGEADGTNTTVQIYQTDSSGYKRPGRAFIHYNARLCKQEIKTLLKNSDMYDPGENSASISYVTNGDKAICGSRKLNVSVTSVNARIAHVTWENYKHTISRVWKLANVRTLLGYEVNYREIDRPTFETQNLTKYDGRDACGGDDWIVRDKQPQDGDVEFMHLTLKPYTYYAIFVSTLLLKEYQEGSEGVEGAESDIVYLHTPEDIPGKPQAVSVERTTFFSVNVSWEPPSVPNGVIDTYELVLEFNPFNEAAILDRDYCQDGHRVEDMGQLEKDTLEKEKKERESRDNKTVITQVIPADGTCTCSTCGVTQESEISKTSKMEEEIFFDALLNRVFTSNSAFDRKKRDISVEESNIFSKTNSNTLRNNMIMVEGNVSKTTPAPAAPPAERNVFEEEDGLKRFKVLNGKTSIGDPVYAYKLPKRRYKMLPGEKKVYLTYSARVTGDQRWWMIPDLEHYGSYTIRVRACQKPYPRNKTQLLAGLPDLNDVLPAMDDDDVDTEEKRCSMDVTKEIRVLHKPGADDIQSEIVQTMQNDTNKIWLSWIPPPDPNAHIVNYRLRFKSRLDADTTVACITAKDFRENGYKYELTMEGSYYVSVQAVSIYGPGNWTKFVWVTIPGQTSMLVLAIVIPLITILVLVVTLLGAYQWKKNKEAMIFQGGLFSDNGAYVPMKYEADHWEVERNRVTICEELGRGAFGKVHRGTYDDPERGIVECAIKTVKDGAPHIECIQFLREAHTMKAFKTEHVVRLLGVVSRCQPHFVLLELMENGDLKTYLRGLRPDVEENPTGKPPPTIREVKQMALEIADGMAYLSTHHKHIVHRDLAARNCMVTRDVVVKIGDFGMAREIYTTDYYKKADKGMMPVRWMAPESLRDGRATTASDVWSFGVVLWEIVTLAELPYQGYSNQDVMENVMKGRIIDRPQNCPEDLYSLMRECWQKRPSQRPSFLDICARLAPYANDRFRENSFFTSADGQGALEAQENERRIAQEESDAAAAEAAAAAEEAEAATVGEDTPCLTAANGGRSGNSNSNGDAYSTSAATTENGHAHGASTAGSGGVPAAVVVPSSSGLDLRTDMRNFNRQTSCSGSSAGGRVPVGLIGEEPSRLSKWLPNGLKSKLRHKSGSAASATSGEV